jgi:hypothetical protein
MNNQDPWDFSYEDDPAIITDERLTFRLLCGIDVRLPNKQSGKEYFAPNSKLERAARAALARLIRKGEPFPGLIRETLAALFDPASATVPIDRHIEFKRSIGNLESRPEAELEIAMHVYVRHYIGGSKNDAVKSAMQQFDLGRSRVFAICSKYADQFAIAKPSRRKSSRVG